MKPPHNVSYLEKALRALAGTDELLVHLRRMLANVIAGQFLDGAVMRGGGSLKFRDDATALLEHYGCKYYIKEDLRKAMTWRISLVSM